AQIHVCQRRHPHGPGRHHGDHPCRALEGIDPEKGAGASRSICPALKGQKTQAVALAWILAALPAQAASGGPTDPEHFTSVLNAAFEEEESGFPFSLGAESWRPNFPGARAGALGGQRAHPADRQAKTLAGPGIAPVKCLLSRHRPSETPRPPGPRFPGKRPLAYNGDLGTSETSR